MHEVDALKNRIRQAFADVAYPGDGQLVAHANYGDEYTLTKEASECVKLFETTRI